MLKSGPFTNDNIIIELYLRSPVEDLLNYSQYLFLQIQIEDT